jgi:hypothetical protein
VPRRVFQSERLFFRILRDFIHEEWG